MLSIIKKRIFDKRVIWLIRKILANSSSQNKGMSLDNLTSQFFANVYLNELDWFVKNKLKAKYYIQYVDDFVIRDKSKILILGNSVNFLGFRIFFYHNLLKKSNIRKIKQRLKALVQGYKLHEINYDSVYDFLEDWIPYAKNVNAYKLRRKITAEFEKDFANEISTKEINRYLKTKKK